MTAEPRILRVGEEPPAMRPPGTEQPRGKPKGKATGERFKTLNTFVDFTATGLPRGALLVWLILFRDTRDGTARTSVADMARRAGCNRSTVIRSVRQLQQAGLLQVVHRGGLGHGPSRYRVRPLPKDGR